MPRSRRSGRRAPRFSTHLSGELLGRRERSLEIVDLSASGCLVASEVRLAPQAILDLRLKLGDEALVAKARVAECSVDGASLPDGGRRYLAGLQFLSLHPADERRLLLYLAARERERAAR